MSKFGLTWLRTVIAVTTCILILGIFVPQASARSLSGPPDPHPHANAATTAPCWETTCDGKDPYSLGCDASIHEISTYVYAYSTSTGAKLSNTPIGKVWNDYSYTCHANWAQGEINYSVDPYLYKFTVKIQDQDSPVETQCYPDGCPVPGGYGGNGIVAWTNMVDGTTWATASVSGTGCDDCEYDPYQGSIGQ